MELTKDEEQALKGERGESLATAYRLLVAIGEATNAEKLIPVSWAHVSGVNYNTIGDPGEEFLSNLSMDTKFSIKTTVNPMGFDFDNVENFDLDKDFIEKQLSIKNSYLKMGAVPSFSCIPYEIFDTPSAGTQVSFAESNAAIYANSINNLKTNKESAFTALASAITGKTPFSDLRMDALNSKKINIRMKIDNPSELDYGLLGYFAGKVGDKSVNFEGVSEIGKRSCKAICGGMGTSGTCGKFTFNKNEQGAENFDFDKKEMQTIFDELNTTDSTDLITFGSPQLGFDELSDLSSMLKGKKFSKRCLIFCPRTVKEKAIEVGLKNKLENSGCEILSDCCICLSPLIKKANCDGVTTNSVKGAFYLNNFNEVDVNLKTLSEIIRDETR